MVNVITQSSDIVLNVVDDDKTIILEGVSIDVPGPMAALITGGMSFLRNAGSIIGQDRFGVVADGSSVRIDNSLTGLIEGSYVALSATIGDSSISNSGVISAAYAAIELASSYDVTVSNRGDIIADYNGIIVGDGSIGTRINNYGDITANLPGSIAVSVSDDSFGTKIYNIGEILAQSFGILNEGIASNIHNQGDIAAAIGIQTMGDARVVNDGVITATTAALIVNGATSNANVTNRGEMFGDLIFDGGDDRLGNAGEITGDIDLGAGRDKFTNTGVVDGDIRLGAERDTYNGQNAKSGAVVFGEAGRDDLRGSDFDDVFDGGADRDVLRTGSGNDVLIGGGDRDVLIGGAGADVFVYKDASDSTEIFDVITDFAAGEDKLDLSLLYAGQFVFDTDALAGNGTPSVFSDVKANTNNFINIDIDGDGFRDMLILLQRAGEVTADDFIL